MEMTCFASFTAVIYSRHQDLLFSRKYTDTLKVQDSQTQSQEAALRLSSLTPQLTLFWKATWRKHRKCQIRVQIETKAWKKAIFFIFYFF